MLSNKLGPKSLSQCTDCMHLCLKKLLGVWFGFVSVFLRDEEKEGKCSFVVLSDDNQVLFSSHFFSGHTDLTPGLQ